MTKTSEKKLKAEETSEKEALINSILVNIATTSTTPATRSLDISLGEVKIKSLTVQAFRVDHYTGIKEEIKQNLFVYSTYSTVIAGIRINCNTYRDLMKLLGALV